MTVKIEETLYYGNYFITSMLQLKLRYYLFIKLS